MNNTIQHVIREVDSIVWDPETSDIQKVHAIQGLLYTWDQMQESPMYPWEQHRSVLSSQFRSVELERE